MNEVTAERVGNTDMAKVVYVLYLIGLVTGGGTLLVGVIIAYIYRDEAQGWLRTHYDTQIRLFWLGLLYCVIAGILCVIFIGFLLFLVIGVWFIIRSVKGLKHLDQRSPYPDPLSWGF
ncbi:MAG TPA: DUF4870 domain-containing protein [Steroidobacteraceae bacterium]|jgi:uncharacterized membrane protein|nr:DUF4870 domain-containing protein [Steroidobacteraceae bacterium]HJY39783.1 DUF4870 domain-containing protein [Steroidobacteraceae bacterium]